MQQGDVGEGMAGAARRIALLCVAAALVATAPCGAAQEDDRNVVLGTLRLRQSLPAVREQYPQMKPLAGGMGVSFVDGPDVKRFVLEGVTPPGLKKATNVELRFWKDQLWLAIVYFGDNDDAAVRQALEKRYGAKEKPGAQAFWDGSDYSAALQTQNRWYSLQDPALTAEAQAWFVAAMGLKASGAAPTPGAAAAPTAAAGAGD